MTKGFVIFYLELDILTLVEFDIGIGGNVEFCVLTLVLDFKVLNLFEIMNLFFEFMRVLKNFDSVLALPSEIFVQVKIRDGTGFGDFQIFIY